MNAQAHLHASVCAFVSVCVCMQVCAAKCLSHSSIYAHACRHTHTHTHPDTDTQLSTHKLQVTIPQRDALHLFSSNTLILSRCASAHKHWQISQQTPVPKSGASPRQGNPIAQSEMSSACLARRATHVNIERCSRRLDFIHSAVSSNTICLRLPKQGCPKQG